VLTYTCVRKDRVTSTIARTLEFAYVFIAGFIRGAVINACQVRRVPACATFLFRHVSFWNCPPFFLELPTWPSPRGHPRHAGTVRGWSPRPVASCSPTCCVGPPPCHVRPPRPCTHAMRPADGHGMGWAGKFKFYGFLEASDGDSKWSFSTS
jgi:hypothetical protein